MTCPPVDLQELLATIEWIDFDSSENEAYISRERGTIHWVGDFDSTDEETPDDIDDETLYIAIPEKADLDLDLGRDLALEFVRKTMPDAMQTVAEMFASGGAFRRFKEWLDRRGALDAWHEFEASAEEAAVRAWAAENGIPLKE